jgi:DNA-binding transcriptional MerR regulator
MQDTQTASELPPIPGKRYFTIGEVSELCLVKAHVLRYCRYYQRQDVLMIRQIRELLYEQGFTITGARARLSGEVQKEDRTQSKQLIRQMINELEGLLEDLK